MAPSPVHFKVENSDGLELKCRLDDSGQITITSANVDLADVFPDAAQLRSFMDEIIRIKQLLNVNGLVQIKATEQEE